MQTSHSCPHCLHHLERFNWEDSESPWLLRNILTIIHIHIYIYTYNTYIYIYTYIYVICYSIRYCISSNHSDQLKMLKVPEFVFINVKGWQSIPGIMGTIEFVGRDGLFFHKLPLNFPCHFKEQ